MTTISALQLLLALSVVLSIGAMIWLAINARSIARLFRGEHSEMEPGPRENRSRPSTRATWAALAVFVIGTSGAIAAWTIGIAQIS